MKNWTEMTYEEKAIEIEKASQRAEKIYRRNVKEMLENMVKNMGRR